jgi:hypothetical protein
MRHEVHRDSSYSDIEKDPLRASLAHRVLVHGSRPLAVIAFVSEVRRGFADAQHRAMLGQ